MAKKTNTFESSLEQLEKIVNKMENENISIDEMLLNFENASELINKLEEELENKRQKFYIVNDKMEVKESEGF